MSYAKVLRGAFPTLEPRVNDLFLLEAHQIAELPGRAPARAFAAVLHAQPQLRYFLVARHQLLAGYIDGLLATHPPIEGSDLAAAEQELLWEIADWITYQRAPELYDAQPIHDWDNNAIDEVAPVAGQIVIDAGAGTGRVAFEALRTARYVFAVEPVARLRQFMRHKASQLGVANLFVLDGTLSAIPLPDHSADVLTTCRAIGWRLEDELTEIERIVKPGGVAVHLTGIRTQAHPSDPLHGGLTEAGYTADSYREGAKTRRRYWKHI
ncbi:MAG: class I SAM-dependent methyltransferase [Actinomycetia bacterium]|nr:class I SAM-dependent methyltransferase [Actinomycetes bacterium]